MGGIGNLDSDPEKPDCDKEAAKEQATSDNDRSELNGLANGPVGIDYIIAFMDAGGVDHSKIMSSIQLLGTEVMPAFNES